MIPAILIPVSGVMIELPVSENVKKAKQIARKNMTFAVTMISLSCFRCSSISIGSDGLSITLSVTFGRGAEPTSDCVNCLFFIHILYTPKYRGVKLNWQTRYSVRVFNSSTEIGKAYQRTAS